MSIEISEMFPRMIGGDETLFFREYWRKRTFFADSVLPQLRSFYGTTRFIEDYKRLGFNDATLLVAVDADGKRNMVRPEHADEVSAALAGSASVVVQSLLLPQDLEGIPPQWWWFLDLYDALCDYLLPGFPSNLVPFGPVAAVDIFCTLSETSSGGHYDTGDVFYFVLEGEKEWTVELVPDLEVGLQLAARKINHTIDRRPLREHQQIRLKPGDCLYVPAYTYHRVSSRGPSLAVSIGLPTFTETTILAHTLSRVLMERALCEPLPSFPRTQPDLFREAEHETTKRVVAKLLEWFPALSKGLTMPGEGLEIHDEGRSNPASEVSARAQANAR